MIGEAHDGFEPGEAVPTELLLKRSELINPASVESMPIAAGHEPAKLIGELTLIFRCVRVVDHWWQDSAEAMVSADEMAE